MTYSRRVFCRNTIFLGLGSSLLSLKSFANDAKSLNTERLVLSRKLGLKVIVEGRILGSDLNPCQNFEIDIFHDNSELNPKAFAYKGKLRTDANGRYSFETDMPQKHYEGGVQKLPRIEFRISNGSDFGHSTKLYFGQEGKAYIDHVHANYQLLAAAENILPKTSFGGQMNTVEFNFFLNYGSKVELS